jgi:cell division protein FtsZ
MLEASIEGARGLVLNISGGSDMGLLEVTEAAEVIHGVTHPDANIIFGAVIDDDMGDEVRVTVIAAGFDRWEDDRTSAAPTPTTTADESMTFLASGDDASEAPDLFADDDDDLDIDDDDDDFDVPSFLK